MHTNVIQVDLIIRTAENAYIVATIMAKTPWALRLSCSLNTVSLHKHINMLASSYSRSPLLYNVGYDIGFNRALIKSVFISPQLLNGVEEVENCCYWEVGMYFSPPFLAMSKIVYIFSVG